MVTPSPFGVTVYGHDFAKKGDILAAALTATVRHNQASNFTLTVPAYVTVDGQRRQTPRLDTLVGDGGARVVITYKGEYLTGGKRVSYTRNGIGPAATYTIQFSDDWDVLERMLAWPTPGSALTSQTVEYDVQSGDAETVIKNLILVNRAHVTPSIVVATNQHRGSSITVQNRFHPLVDRTVPLLDGAGIGVTVQQSGAGLLFDCYATRAFPRTITEESGILGDLTLSWSAPTATRVIVGGPGDGTARRFTIVIDTAAEAILGYAIEAFLDATDTDDNGTTGETQRQQRGSQFLIEHATQASISADLFETAAFRFMPSGANGTVRLGDQLTIVTEQGATFSDVLRSVTLSWSADDGLKVTPQIGERADSETAVVNAIADVQRIVRNNARR